MSEHTISDGIYVAVFLLRTGADDTNETAADVEDWLRSALDRLGETAGYYSHARLQAALGVRIRLDHGETAR